MAATRVGYGERRGIMGISLADLVRLQANCAREIGGNPNHRVAIFAGTVEGAPLYTWLYHDRAIHNTGGNGYHVALCIHPPKAKVSTILSLREQSMVFHGGRLPSGIPEGAIDCLARVFDGTSIKLGLVRGEIHREKYALLSLRIENGWVFLPKMVMIKVET
jgi:hypothetical protein